MQKFIKQNNLNHFDVVLIVLCMTIFMWAIAVKAKILEFNISDQINDDLKVASVVDIDNDVRVRRNNVFFWKDSSEGESLVNGEALFVGGRSKGVIEFINKDKIIISENSIIKIKFDKENNLNQLELTQGNIELQSEADTKLVINGTEIETKGKSALSINNDKSKLQFVSNKGEARIGDIVLLEGNISDGTKVTKVFKLNMIGGTVISTTDLKTNVQAEFSGLEELGEKVDTFKIHLRKKSTGVTDVLRFSEVNVQFLTKPGKYTMHAEAYVNGEIIGQTAKLDFEVKRVGTLKMLYPNPSDRQVYIPENEPVRFVWKKICECEYDIKITDLSDQKLVLETHALEEFVDFSPMLKTYSISIQANEAGVKVDSVLYEFEFKSSTEFNPKLLFSFLSKKTIFKGGKVPLKIETLSDAKITKLKLFLSSDIEFSNPILVEHANDIFHFKKGGSYYYKAQWDYEGNVVEKTNKEKISIIDLDFLLAPPEAVEETNFRKIQSVEITATQTLRWAKANSIHPTFYRIEIADNREMKSSKVVETDVNTIDVTLKLSKQFWRIKKIVRIDNVLYEGDYSKVFEIKAYVAPDMGSPEAQAKASASAKKEEAKKDDASKSTTAVAAKAIGAGKSATNSRPSVSSKSKNTTRNRNTRSRNNENSDSNNSASEDSSASDSLSDTRSENFIRNKTVNTTGAPINTRGQRNSGINSRSSTQKQREFKPRSVKSTPVGVPGMSLVEKIGDDDFEVPDDSSIDATFSETKPEFARPISEREFKKEREQLIEALAAPPIVSVQESPIIDGKPAPKIVFRPLDNINFKSNKVQINIDNFDAKRVKYAKFQYNKISKTVPMKSAKLTIKADKMPTKTKIFLLDKNKKAISTMNLDLDPFYKNGCSSPKVKVLRTSKLDDVAIVSVALEKNKYLFLNFKRVNPKKGKIKISLGREYTVSNCWSPSVKLFKNSDLTRMLVPRKLWSVYGILGTSSFSLDSSGSSSSASGFSYGAGITYLIPKYRLTYKGSYEAVSGSFAGNLSSYSFNYSEIQNTLYYDLKTEKYDLLTGLRIDSITTQKFENNKFADTMIHFFGVDFAAMYDLRTFKLGGNLFAGMSAGGSMEYGLRASGMKEITSELDGELYFQYKSFTFSETDLAVDSIGTRTSVGAQLNYSF